MSTFASAADAAYNTLLAIETDAVDADADRRFYASYLLGHVSLVAAGDGSDADDLNRQLTQSLDEAFAVDRLSDQDKDGIRSLWQAISADIGRGL
jgi:hypothetical protein